MKRCVLHYQKMYCTPHAHAFGISSIQKKNRLHACFGSWNWTWCHFLGSFIPSEFKIDCRKMKCDFRSFSVQGRRQSVEKVLENVKKGIIMFTEGAEILVFKCILPTMNGMMGFFAIAEAKLHPYKFSVHLLLRNCRYSFPNVFSFFAIER